MILKFLEFYFKGKIMFYHYDLTTILDDMTLFLAPNKYLSNEHKTTFLPSRNVQIAAILDQKNYVEELNRQLK